MRKIIVIGGGPAGLMAAATAAEEGTDVLLLEKMPRPALKLRITGKGRCNLTNIADTREFLKNFSDGGNFIKPAFWKFSNKDLVRFFNELGVRTKVERGKRVFLESDSAGEAVTALVNHARKNGVRIKTSSPVKSLIIENGTVTGVEEDSGKKHRADAVILATGGASYQGTGSAGEGYNIAREAGHTVTGIRPALIPVKTEGDIASRLQGLSLKNVEAGIYVEGRKEASEFGELLFTHYGLSGPIILTLSRIMVNNIIGGRKVEISIDLKPALSHKQLDRRLLRELEQHCKKNVITVMKFLLPRRMTGICLEQAGVPPHKKANEITARERKNIRVWLKDFRLKVSGYRPLEEAIVTAGGISTAEINRQDMSSRIVERLYFAGEVIDMDADTGGYNLQAAFSSGRAAGLAASSR